MHPRCSLDNLSQCAVYIVYTEIRFIEKHSVMSSKLGMAVNCFYMPRALVCFYMQCDLFQSISVYMLTIF